MDSTKTIDLNRIANGDVDEWTEMVNRFYKLMLRHATSIVRDIHSASDVVQQVLTNLWIKKSQLWRVESLVAYLTRATKNAAITYLRQLAMGNSQAIDPEIPEPVEELRKSDPLTIVCLEELSQTVLTARDNLCSEQQKVVDHFLSNEKSSIRQAGRYLGCSPQNVQQIMCRVRPKFQQADELLRK